MDLTAVQRRNPASILVCTLAFALGTLNVVVATASSIPARVTVLRDLLPLVVSNGSRLVTVIAGLFLLLLTPQLARRKATAWGMTVVLVSLAAFSHLASGLEYESAAANLGLLVILIAVRGSFRTRSDLPSARHALRFAAVSLFAAYLYGVLGLYLLEEHFRGRMHFAKALMAVGRMYLGLDPGFRPISERGEWFVASLSVMGIGTLFYVAALLLRPVVWRQRTWPGELLRATDIAERFGRTSVTAFTLGRDKHLFLNNEGTTYVSFRAVGDVALALGDPVGPPAEVVPTAEGFRTFCMDNGWTPAFYQVSDDHREEYRTRGWRAVKIGEEAIVNFDTFSIEGARGKDFRYALNHFKKLGTRALLLTPPVSESVIEQLRPVSNQWLAHKGNRERPFAMGQFNAKALQKTDLLVVEDIHGEVLAFASFVPMPARRMVAVDLMRHRDHPPNGLMDFLFLQAILTLRERGYVGLSLGLAPLANVGREPDASVPDQVGRLLYDYFDRLYNFQGLHAFKQKFSPSWEPRYLLYPGLTSLPAVAVALVRVDGTPRHLLPQLQKNV